jgi:hypothetical protein
MIVVKLDSGLVAIQEGNDICIYEEGYAPSMEMSCIDIMENRHFNEFSNKEELQDAIEKLNTFG